MPGGSVPGRGWTGAAVRHKSEGGQGRQDVEAIHSLAHGFFTI